MALFFGGVIMLFCLIVIGLTVFLVMWSDGSIGKNKMNNIDNISKDATVISVTPKIYGTKGASHYEAVVKFSDGSFFRTDCNLEKGHLFYKEIAYDRSREAQIVKKAIEAHDYAAQAKRR